MTIRQTTLTEYLASTAERQSECTRCPAWVIACFHEDSNPVPSMAVVDFAMGNAAHTCGHEASGEGFSVIWGNVSKHPCTQETCQSPQYASADWRDFPTRAEAEAEFRRREAELLGETL